MKACKGMHFPEKASVDAEFSTSPLVEEASAFHLFLSKGLFGIVAFFVYVCEVTSLLWLDVFCSSLFFVS